MAGRYVPLRHYFDPTADLWVPREWPAGVAELFRFNRSAPACIAANFESTDIEPNIFNTVAWEELIVDTDGMFSRNVSPTQLTVRTPGLWAVLFSVQYLPDDEALHQEARLFRNRTDEVIQGVTKQSPILIHGIQRLAIWTFNEGDFLEVDLWASSGTDDRVSTFPPFFLGMFFIGNPALQDLP